MNKPPHESSKPRFDWDSVYQEYRLDLYSNRELGKRWGPSEAMIRKKAKAEKWEKDLSNRVQEKFRSMMAQSDGAEGALGVRGASARTLDNAIVDAAAQKMLSIQNRHRSQLERLTSIADGLMEELSRIDRQLVEVDKMIDDSDDQLVTDSMMAKRLKLNAFKASTLESLARSYHRLIPLERQAYGLDSIEDNSSSEAAKEIRTIISSIRSRLGESESGPGSVKDADDTSR